MIPETDLIQVNELPPKRKTSKALIVFVITMFVIVVVSLGVGLKLTLDRSVNDPKQVDEDNIIVDEHPLEGAIYLAEVYDQKLHSNINVAFYRGYSDRAEESDTGAIIYPNGNQGTFSYKSLINPRRGFVLDQTSNIYITPAVYITNDPKIMYFAVATQNNARRESDLVVEREYIYKVDLISHTGYVIWDKDLNGGIQPYDDKKGEGGIITVEEDKYMAIAIGPCYACGGAPWVKSITVVLNISTGKEVNLGEVGDVQFDLLHNKVVAHKLILEEQSCEVGYLCSDGTWQVAVPKGDAVESSLP